MAVALDEGAYALQQENSKKIVFQLKLTDSSLRALEGLGDDVANGRRLKPTIWFKGNQGAIHIPSKDHNGKQTFTFHLSSLSHSTAVDCHSSAVDCLQQHNSWNSMGTVSALGEIQQKLTIHANDDTYNATRIRMEKVKEQEKNVSTKVIKQPSSSKLTGKKKLLGRQYMEGASTASPGKSNQSFPRSVSPLSSSSSIPPGSTPDLAGMRNKTKPVLSSISSRKSPSRLVAGKPLQEKVLHYLAIRPIRLHDLITRLARSTTHVEKGKVQNLLNQMATSRFVATDVMEFSLNKSFFNNVSPDWLGYEEEEKLIVRRNVEACRNSDSRKRPALPIQLSPKTSPTSNAAIQEESYSNPLKKKARVSLYTKTSPNNPRPPSTPPFQNDQLLTAGSTSSDSLLSSSSVVDLNSLDVNDLIPPGDKMSDHRFSKSSLPKNKHGQNDVLPSKPFVKESSSDTVMQTIPTKVKTGSINCPKVPSRPRYTTAAPTKQLSPGNDGDDVSNPLYDATIPSPDDSNGMNTLSSDHFIRKYRAIKFVEERDRYKADFYSEYKEYLSLHQELTVQSKRFAAWEAELKQQEKYTEKYKMIARRVFDEYCRLKQDGIYMKQRERFAHLYRKLKHIKNLVLEFDRKQFAPKRGGDMPPLSNPHRSANNGRPKAPY